MDYKILIAALVFILLFNLIFFGYSLVLGFGFLALALHIYFFITRKSDSPNLLLGILSSGLAILFAFLIAYRANEIVQVFDFLLASYFSAVSISLYKKTTHFVFAIPEFILMPLITGVSSLEALFGSNHEQVSLKSKNAEINQGLIRGFAIALPVILVLVLLLASADPVFSKIVGDLFSQIGQRVIVSVVLFIGLFIAAITKYKEFFTNTANKTIKLTLAKTYELSLITGSIIVLFGTFIFIQFQYLFSDLAEGELAKLGIKSLTYSEYINKGFFELLIASSIAALVLTYVFHYLHKFKDNQKRLIQTFSAILTIETGLLLLSAAKRDLLYAGEHGLTRARILGFIFLIWLATMLLVFLVRSISELNKKYLFTLFLTTSLIAVLSINVLNIDDLIAHVYPPTVNKETDYVYITNLSADAHQGWKDAYLNVQNTVEKQKSKEVTSDDSRITFYNDRTLLNLDKHISILINKYGTLSEMKEWYKKEDTLSDKVKKQRSWQAFNLSEYQAYQYIIENKQLFFNLHALQNEVGIQRKRIPANLQNAPLDRSINAPLTK